MAENKTSESMVSFSEDELREKTDAFSATIEKVDIKNLLNEDVERSRNAVLKLTILIIVYCLFSEFNLNSLGVKANVSPAVESVSLVFVVFLLALFSWYYLLNAKTDRIGKQYKKDSLEDTFELFKLYLDEFQTNKISRRLSKVRETLNNPTFHKKILNQEHLNELSLSQSELTSSAKTLHDKIYNNDEVKTNLISYIKDKFDGGISTNEKFAQSVNLDQKESEILEKAIQELSSDPYFSDINRLVQLRTNKKKSLEAFQEDFDTQMRVIKLLPKITVGLCALVVLIVITIKLSTDPIFNEPSQPSSSSTSQSQPAK